MHSSVDRLAYTSFVDLGGRVVSLGEVREELGRLPLDMVLGVLSRLSAHYVQKGDRFFHPRFQGELLAPAIVDDFPCALPCAAQMYVPGRVPITGGKHTFIHEHNLCALTKLALAHARTGSVTDSLTTHDYGRVGRLLLVVNDHLSSLHPSTGENVATLKGRRAFAVDVLYRGQFEHYQGEPRRAFAALARLRLLLVRHFPDAQATGAAFQAKTGLDLEWYFNAAALLMSHAFATLGEIGPEQSPWMNVDWFARIPSGQALEQLVRGLSLRMTALGVASTHPQGAAELFEFQELQATPIVEARPGEFIVPVYSLLLRQLLSYPILVLRERAGFLEELGHSYEEYAHGLAVRIAAGAQPALTVRENERLAGGEIDTLLYGGGVAVVMEHKAKQVVSTLGNMSVARNALGPNDAELEAIATTDRPKDKGGVTQPIWQFRAFAHQFEEHSLRSWNHHPTSVFPLVTMMEAYRIDEWVRRGYLEPLIEASATQFPPSWSGIEWLHVSDLEALAELADQGKLELITLLRSKASQPWKRFDMFIAEQHGGLLPLDQKLWAEAVVILDRVSSSFSSGATERRS